jgi:DNA-binding Lrp family transcriptional regulator
MSKKNFYQPLSFAENYYISKEGYIFYLSHEIQLLPFIKNSVITVLIKGQEYSVLNLMIEYFIYENKEFTYEYTQDKMRPLRIPLRNIKRVSEIKTFNGNDSFNCISRVYTANKRAKECITIEDVQNVLKRDNYKCIYCNKNLTKNNWHLDHVKPLSKNGKNEFNNLAASCKTCNLMKNSMIKVDFIAKCGTIYNFNKPKEVNHG